MLKNFKEFLNESELSSLEIKDSVLIECNDKTLTSITIPDSVTSIGNSAFRYCKSLASITIPDSVTSIGNDAFQDCTKLASITIPDSVMSIGIYAFDGCPLKGLDLVTALLITKLSNRDVMDCVKKELVLSRLEQQKVMKFARMHNVFDLVKPYIDDDLWHANRGSRGITNLED